MEGKPWGMGMPPPSGLGFPGGAADVPFTEEVISKDNTHGFAFTFYFFFSPLLLGVKYLGGCYKSHS